MTEEDSHLQFVGDQVKGTSYLYKTRKLERCQALPLSVPKIKKHEETMVNTILTTIQPVLKTFGNKIDKEYLKISLKDTQKKKKKSTQCLKRNGQFPRNS